MGTLSNAHIITAATPKIRTSLRALMPKSDIRPRRRNGRLVYRCGLAKPAAIKIVLAGGKESHGLAV